jgi:outer membrane murein-binding lipoprotein Lpp
MEVTMVSPKRFLLLGVAAVTVALFAAACDDGAESNDNASQGSVDTLSAQVQDLRADVQRTQMMHALLALSRLGLHDMDEGLNSGGAIESSYIPNTRAAWRVFALTDWHDDVRDDAEALRDEAAALLEALEADDADAAKEHARALHTGEHDFSAAVWELLLSEAGVEEPGDDGHGDDSGTPAAGATQATPRTPAAGATPGSGNGDDNPSADDAGGDDHGE